MSASPNAASTLRRDLATREVASLAAPRRRRLLTMGWPLVALFAGYPLWWALGIAPFVALAAAIPLALELRRHGRLRAPRGFGMWLVFLGWLLVGILLLQVAAPDAIPTTSGSRYATFLFRFMWFAAATIVLLYVGNLRKELSLQWFCRTIGTMFIVIVAGGLLGWAAPKFQFESPMELLLGSHGKSPFIQNLIHPSAAQIQVFLGYEQGRPSAPFSFTNSWGVNCAVTLPFFIVGWFHRTSQMRKVFGAVVLVLSLIPIVSSLNRGLWVALIACALMLTVRTALQGKPLMLAGGLLAGGIAALIIILSPLGGLVGERLAHGNSNSGRTNLGTQTLVSTVTGSPIVGFGTTRDPAGNWVSIAAGASAQCPRCTPPPLGTQGQAWLVMFTSGFGGLILYIGFFVYQFCRGFWVRSIYATAGLSAVTMAMVTAPFYNTVDPSLLVIMAAVGLMWRARVVRDVRSSGRSVDVALTSYPGLVKRHWLSMLLLPLLGLLVGAGLQAAEGTTYQASQRVLVRDIRNGDTATGGEVSTIDYSLDTEAQLTKSDRVTDAIRRVVGPNMTRSQALESLSVTALPNTRVLVLHVNLTNQAKAGAAAAAAGNAYLEERSALLNASRAGQLQLLQTRQGDVARIINRLTAAVPAAQKNQSQATRTAIDHLSGELRYLEASRNRLMNNPLAVGELAGATYVAASHDGLIVKAASGLALGAAIWAALASLLDGAFRRIGGRRRWSRRRSDTVLPIIGRVSLHPHGTHAPALCDLTEEGSALTDAATALRAFAPVSAVLAPQGPEPVRQVASALDRVVRDVGRRTSGRVVFVADSRMHASDIVLFERRSRASGLDPIGLILVHQ